jgi:50S ribosomal subunit-associated GTPase HflX
MNKLPLIALIFGALISNSALAVDAHHPEQQDQGPKASAPASAADNKAAQKMQENVKKMQAQLDKIQKTKDPKARQKLLQEHMQTMRENMMLGKSMMPGMMDCAMMKDGMMGGGMGMMGGGEAGASPDAMMNRMNMMEKRMDMMQMMMEQMTKPQSQPVPAK